MLLAGALGRPRRFVDVLLFFIVTLLCASVLANAAPATLLASAALSLVHADAAPATLLASAALSLVLTRHGKARREACFTRRNSTHQNDGTAAVLAPGAMVPSASVGG